MIISAINTTMTEKEEKAGLFVAGVFILVSIVPFIPGYFVVHFLPPKHQSSKFH